MRPRLYFILFLATALSSCAGIMNRRDVGVEVVTAAPAIVVAGGDSVTTGQNNKAVIRVPRSSAPLVLDIITDTTVKHIRVPAKNSNAFKWNIFFNWGIGMLVDYYNPKRYVYPKVITLNPKDTVKGYTSYGAAGSLHEVHFFFSLPAINGFFINAPGGQALGTSGFLGFSAGMDYYYDSFRFARFTTRVAGSWPLPFPVWNINEGFQERAFIHSFSLTHHHQVKRFIVGYGISLTKNIWEDRFTVFNNGAKSELLSRASYGAAGLSGSLYYRANRQYFIGVVYQPTFLTFVRKNLFSYNHLISLDLCLKFRL